MFGLSIVQYRARDFAAFRNTGFRRIRDAWLVGAYKCHVGGCKLGQLTTAQYMTRCFKDTMFNYSAARTFCGYCHGTIRKGRLNGP